MIRLEDFQIEVGETTQGTYVRVLHVQTGISREANPVHTELVRNAVERLLNELKSEVLKTFKINLADFEKRAGRTTTGSFMQLVHVPTGKHRLISPLGKYRGKELHELESKLFDELVEELAQGPANSSNGAIINGD